jgi:predicted membrane protein
METNENIPQHPDWEACEKSHRRGKVYGGVFIIIIGTLFLLKELGVLFPEWLFTWKAFLIGLGLFMGFKHRFRNPGWIILILVGGAFLVSDLFPELLFRPLIWPVVIILFGFFLISGRKKHAPWKRWERHHRHSQRQRHYREYEKYKDYYSEPEVNSEEQFDLVAFMSGLKKNVLTKNFKRGTVTAVFGGAELNFSQADFDEKAKLEINQVFGGTKLIIPAHWEIESQLVSVFGSVEDKRGAQPINNQGPRKILILEGNTVFGGIEIKSF